MNNFDPILYRLAFSELPSTSAWESLTPPKRNEIYFPSRQVKALSPEASIVEGMRGAGKSFWTAVLADDTARTFLAKLADSNTISDVVVRIGFGLDLDSQNFPNAQKIASLLLLGCTPDDIWRSILLRYALKEVNIAIPFADQIQAAALWVKNNRDAANDLLGRCDRALENQNKTLLLVFDSLDRLASDWPNMRKLLSVALQLGLECRTRRSMRCKFFLRPEMVEENDELWRFSDSSKLLHNKGELSWSPNDLFGLILLHLANSERVGAEFRNITQQEGATWNKVDGIYTLPLSQTVREQPLRSIIESLAGPWVGTSARRGFTFTWIPTHLSDAKGHLSPRSILLAFRHAAQWTHERHPDHPTALHFEGIQQGVVAASEIRISEMKEDYPWVGPLLEALNGSTVPLTLSELEARWTQQCIDSALNATQDDERLPPRHYSKNRSRQDGVDGVKDLVSDLVDLAILYRTEDERFNMPDIFRVGFGIKRKGGVKPPR